MQLDRNTFDGTLQAFLEAWPLERVESMTLSEYADLSDHDSFCYWLEYGTKSLGAIGNNPLTKFGIWKPRHPKDFSERIHYDGEYAWYATKGNDRNSAFQRVRNDIVEIVRLSINGNWDQIEQIDYHKIAKWKIAFLYSDRQLLPIYSKRALMAISAGLGRAFSYNTDTYVVQQYILSFREKDEGIDDLAHRLYTTYARKPNYFIIGSKYNQPDGGTVDIYPSFIQNRCISIGYLWYSDFSGIKGADAGTINQFIKVNRSSNEPALFKVSSQIKKFLSLRPGDIIAVKSHGRFNRLTIIAYAIVVERDGKVYEHDPDNLGHITHVEFLETGFSKALGLNYADSIHEIKASNPNFKSIFSKFELDDEFDEAVVDETQEILDIPTRESDPLEESIYDKSEEDLERSMVSKTIVKQVHSKIQNRFVRALKRANPKSTIAIEHRRIDVVREDDANVWLYEIKPYDSSYRCVRESLGQLLDYSSQYNSNKSINLTTVGPEKPDDKGQQFIEFIRKNLGIRYSYVAFNVSDSSITEH